MSQPSLDGTIIRRIRDYANAMGWPKSRLAAHAAMPPNTLKKFHDADWNPTADTLRRLEALIPADFRPPAARPKAARPKPRRPRRAA